MPWLLRLCSVGGCIQVPHGRAAQGLQKLQPGLVGLQCTYLDPLMSSPLMLGPQTKMTSRVGPGVTGLCPQAQEKEAHSAAGGLSSSLTAMPFQLDPSHMNLPLSAPVSSSVK